MLPIDEHAWAGDFVFAKFSRGYRVVRWCAKSDWWEDQFGHALGSEHPTHYLPASWVEQAGAMRAELEKTRSWIDTCVPIGTESATHRLGRILDVLTATEWPPNQEGKR